jgi:hypothetical protein
MSGLLSIRDTGRCGQAVDGPVLSGTFEPVPSGTPSPCYRERERLVTHWHNKAKSAPSNLPNTESFGFFLTQPGKSAAEHNAAAGHFVCARHHFRTAGGAR